MIVRSWVPLSPTTGTNFKLESGLREYGTMDYSELVTTDHYRSYCIPSTAGSKPWVASSSLVWDTGKPQVIPGALFFHLLQQHPRFLPRRWRDQ